MSFQSWEIGGDPLQKLLNLGVKCGLFFLFKQKVKGRFTGLTRGKAYRSSGHTLGKGKTDGGVLGQLLAVFSPVFDQGNVAGCLPLGLVMSLYGIIENK